MICPQHCASILSKRRPHLDHLLRHCASSEEVNTPPSLPLVCNNDAREIYPESPIFLCPQQKGRGRADHQQRREGTLGKEMDRGNMYKETSKEESRYPNKSPSFIVLLSYFFISSRNSHTDKQSQSPTAIITRPLLRCRPPYFLTPLSRPDPQSSAFKAAFKGAGSVSSSSSPSTPSSPPALPWNTYAYP